MNGLQDNNMDPDISQKHRKRLIQIQESLQCKLEIDASRLVILANTLTASTQTKDLKLGLVIVKWWMYTADRDLKRLEPDLEIKHLDIDPLDSVFKSIQGMKKKIQDAVDILSCTLHVIERPEPLLWLCLQTVEEDKLDLEDLPVTLKDQARCWSDTKEERNRDKTRLLARVVHRICNML